MTPIARTVRLTAAESFWYVLGCIGFGAMYFCKVPVKKALSEAGLAHMTGAEQFWYVLQCIAFGGGYFAKIPVKKALSELAQAPTNGYQPVSAPGYEPDYGRQIKAPRYAPLPGEEYPPQSQGYGQPSDRLPRGHAQELPPGRHSRHQGPRRQGY